MTINDSQRSIQDSTTAMPKLSFKLSLEAALAISERATPVGKMQFGPTTCILHQLSRTHITVEHTMTTGNGPDDDGITYGLKVRATGREVGNYFFFTDVRGRFYHDAPVSDVRVRNAFSTAQERWNATAESFIYRAKDDESLSVLAQYGVIETL